VRDPGLDRHEWETEWQALEPELEDSPSQALPELADLVERMLRERGFPIDDEVAGDGIEPDILVEYRSAREVTTRIERGEDVDPGDVGEAVHNFRDIYAQLIDRPSSP
jgi:hypothetical protein